MTWASVASRNLHQKRVNQQPQARPREKIPVKPQVLNAFNECERRTQVLRKVPPATTALSILNDLKAQSTLPLGEVIEAVVQEPLDRRRFYIVYKSVELKRSITQRGFRIGEIQIPPQRADVQGYIPDAPHYLSKEDVHGILSRYGVVVSGKFKTYEDTEIRCGGYEFELNLHENQRLPGTIQILSDILTIKLKDDIMICSFCDKVGHTHRHCRKKLVDQMAKALNAELQQQPNDRSADENMDEDSGNQQQQQQQHQQQNNATTDEFVGNEQTFQQQQTGNVPPQGTPPPPSPLLTPMHPTPEAPGGSTSSGIPAGQGTPTNPSTTKEDPQQRSLNPVYHPADPSETSVTFEELDEKLNSLLTTFWGLSMKSNHPTKTKDELTTEEYENVKRLAWEAAVASLRFDYNTTGRQQFAPFMEERERRIQAARGGHPTS